MNLPFITSDLPGIGGEIKSRPEYFIVDEIPVYEPEGKGDHVFVRISRQGWNTRDLAQKIGELFDLKEVEVGTAGQKDKNALATQTFSLFLPGLAEDAVAGTIAAGLDVQVLSAKRHVNKLKTGHLLGNRFAIVLENPRGDALIGAEKIATALRERGLPNYYGPQRFGRDGENIRTGRQALEGKGPRGHWLRKFLLSAYQAFLFNDYLADRIERGWFNQVLAGDLVKKTDTGGMFLVEDLEAEQARFLKNEITFTGPIFGTKMRRPAGPADALELEILARHEVTESMFKKNRLEGSRRPGRLHLPGLEISEHPQGLLLQFVLPKGAYATTLVREITKNETMLPEE
ncbi:MAG: tRNA pseudouridine(13) synthase TruD [Pseudomonadota bacterium]